MFKNSLLIISLLLSIPSFSAPIVPLSVFERAGLARTDEPVLMGVPLPESLYSDISIFALKDESGNVIPCEFRAANKWFRDKQSIRWLHIDFQTSLAANQNKTVYLCDEPASHAVSGSKLSVTDLGTKIQVTTGPLRFTVKKQNFNLFDEAWIDESGGGTFDDAHKIIASHNKGFSLLTTGGERYYASNDNSMALTVERQGPMAVVLRAEGYLKNSSGSALFWFDCRIYAYNNSKIVRVVYSWENRNNDVSAFVSMYGMNLEVPLNLGSSKHFGIGDKGGPKTGTLNAADTAGLLMARIDKYRFLGAVAGDSGNTRIDGASNYDFGTAWMSDGSKGAGISEQYFWQTYPSSVELQGNGTINLGMFSHRFTEGDTVFPPRFRDHYNMYSGMGRMHEIRFVFYNDDGDAEVRSELVGVNSRVFAAAPAVWYTRGTRCFGNLLEKGNSSLYLPAHWATVNNYETYHYNGAMKCLGGTNSAIGGKDNYDYLGWGDNGHQLDWSWGGLMWNGNYYDLPYVFYIHFIRQINYLFLDYAIAHSQSVQDLHLVHFEANNPQDGACRYCPPMNQIGADAPEPDVQGHTSHHKTQSLWAKYCLLGDDRALEVAKRGLKWIEGLGVTMTNAGNLTTSRRIGHVFNTLNWAYQFLLTAPELAAINANLDALKTTVAAGGIPGQGWMAGLALEGVTDAYYATGRADVPPFLKQCLDLTTGMVSNAAYASGFTYRFYNQATYFSKMGTLLTDFGDGTSFLHHEKDYAENGRSIAKALYFYGIPDSAANKNVSVVSLEERLQLGEPHESLLTMPNPVNAGTTIYLPQSVHGNRLAPALVKVYSLDGRLAADLSAGIRPGCRSVQWRPNGISSGVYVVRCVKNGKQYKAKIALVR
jgi:hypothetical protein